jgi:thioredoxin-like negative regulator of GroEL
MTVLQSERPKLVFVYSGRQGRSRQVDGYVAQILQRRRNHDTFELVRIDVDERPDVAERLHVTSVPTLLVITGRRVHGRLAEPKGRAPIADLLSPWLK